MSHPRRFDRLPLLLIILISFFALLIFPCTSKSIKNRFNSKNHDLQPQKVILVNGEKSSKGEKEGDVPRRNLRGLGSSPPRCASKCGNCTPCKPVHVPVPPGTPVTAEYYPEAWRCKCGNKLYIP